MKTLLLVPLILSSAFGQVSSDSTDTLVSRPRNKLEIQSRPPGATVWIDTSIVGVTPIVLSGLPYGQRVVRLHLEGHAEFVDTVLLRFGTEHAIAPQLLEIGGIRVVSDPTGARVFLADTLLGTTPLVDSGLATGWTSIRLEAPEFRPFVSSVFIRKRRFVDFSARLMPLVATLSVQTYSEDCWIIYGRDTLGRGGMRSEEIPTGTKVLRVEDPLTGQSDEVVVPLVGPPVDAVATFGNVQRMPLVWSLAIPGTGQTLDGSRTKGIFMTAGFVASMGIAFVQNMTVKKRIAEYDPVRREYLEYAGSSDRELVELRKEAQQRYDAATRARTWVVPSLAVAAVIYCVSLVDVVLNHSYGISITIKTKPVGGRPAESLGATIQIPLIR